MMAFDSDYNISYLFDQYDYDYSLFDYDDINWLEHPAGIPSAFHLFYGVSFIIIFCISMPGNIFLLWVLLRERAWKTTSDILLLQLITSDLCLTVTLPFWTSSHLHSWIFGDLACGVITWAEFVGLDSYVLILTAMMMYHYVTVVHASCLSAQAPQKFGVVASIAIWMICATASLRLSVKSEAVDNGSGHILCAYVQQSLTTLLIDIYIQIGLFFLVPFIIITFCCVHMWITIIQRRINRYHQVSRLILGMAVVFFLCLIPYYIILFLHSLVIADVTENTFLYTTAMYYAKLIINTLPYFHCCLNPLFHIFGAQRFRSHLPGPCNTSSQRRDGSHNPRSMAVVPPHDTPV